MNIDIDHNTKIALVILLGAIVVSAIGSLAIAFALGYLVSTIVHSQQFQESALMGNIQAWLQAAGLRKVVKDTAQAVAEKQESK